MNSIYFDLDGTIVNLYGVDNWLEKLRNFDASPYEEASPLLDISQLEQVLIDIQSMGIKIGIISALAKVSNDTYDEAVTNAKIKWVKTHFKHLKFDDIIIIPYNSPKESYGTADDIIFDDSASVRNNWCGIAYDVNNIISDLHTIKATI
jgi:intein/homing endonuclease